MSAGAPPDATPSSPPELQRSLGAGSALLITVGAMVGSGVFATPHEVAQRVRSGGAMLAVWLAGGLLSLLGALTYAELGAALPLSGGLYAHLRSGYGRRVAFVFGWAMAVVLVPSSVGYFAQVSAQHALEALGVVATPGRTRVFSAAMLAALLLANLRGVRSGAAVQNAATVVKYGGVLLVAALGAYAGRAVGALDGAAVPDVVVSRALPALAASSEGVRAAGGWVAALVPVLWAYDGWIELTSVAGELRSPQRVLPRALVAGTLAVAGLYLMVNAGYLAALGPAGLASVATPGLAAAQRAVGTPGRVLVGALVAVSTFGGCAVSLLTGARVLHAVGRDGLAPRLLGALSPQGVPSGALALAAGLGLAYAASPLGRLGEVFVIGAWPFYALGALALPRLRARARARGEPWPLRLRGQPALAWLFALCGAAIVAVYALTEPRRTLASAGLILLGVPLDAWVQRRARVSTAP